MDTRLVTQPIEQSRKPFAIIVAAGVVLATTIAGAGWLSQSSGNDQSAPVVAPVLAPIAEASRTTLEPKFHAANSTRLQVWLVDSADRADAVAEMLAAVPASVAPNVTIQLVNPEQAEAYFAAAQLESGLGLVSGMDVIDLRPR